MRASDMQQGWDVAVTSTHLAVILPSHVMATYSLQVSFLHLCRVWYQDCQRASTESSRMWFCDANAGHGRKAPACLPLSELCLTSLQPGLSKVSDHGNGSGSMLLPAAALHVEPGHLQRICIAPDAVLDLQLQPHRTPLLL